MISYVEIERLAASPGVDLLVRLLARRMAAQRRSLGGGRYAAELLGELSTDLLGSPSERCDEDDGAVAQLLADKARQQWAGQSQLLMRSHAELLYQRLKYGQLDAFSPRMPEHFVVRVLYSDGSSLVQTTARTTTVAAAIAAYRHRLAHLSGPSTFARRASSLDLTGGSGVHGAHEWVLQVPSCGEIFGADDEQPLASKPYLQRYLQQLHRCRHAYSTMPAAAAQVYSPSHAAMLSMLSMLTRHT